MPENFYTNLDREANISYEDLDRETENPYASLDREAGINLPEGFILDKPEPEQEEPGTFPQRAYGAFMRGGMKVGEAVAALPGHIIRQAKLEPQFVLAEMHQRFGTPERDIFLRQMKSIEGIYDKIADFVDKPVEIHKAGQRVIQENHPEWVSQPPKNFVDLLTSPDKLAISLVESTPLLVAAGILTAAGAPALSIGLMYASEGQQAYDMAIADGRSRDEAESAFQIYGIVAAGLEQMQLQGILKIGKSAFKQTVNRTAQKVAKHGFKNLTYDIIKVAGQEAVEEMAQGTWQEATAKIVYDKSIPGGTGDFIDRRAQEGLIGFAMGVIPGAAGGLSGSAKAHIFSKEAETQIDQDTTLTSEEKIEHKTYIGDIRTKVVEHVVETFPEKVTDQASLEQVGNAIAKELGMNPPTTWSFKKGTARTGVVKGYHRKSNNSITVFKGTRSKEIKNSRDIKWAKDDLGLDVKIGDVLHPSQNLIKRVVVHELGHMAKPPIVKRARRSVHHRAFKDWVQENMGILEIIRQEHVPLEEIAPQAVAEGEPARRKPTYAQYEAGHAIPKLLKMRTTARRKFMKKITGKTSMKEMTPEEASKYIEALHKKARKKGIETGILPGERAYKTPKVGHLGTDPLYEMHALGVAFAVRPAAIAKQKLDIEFRQIAKKIDKAGALINRLGGETTKSKAAAKLKNKPTKSIVRFAELLDTHEEPPAGLTKDEAEIFNYFRVLSRAIWTRENIAREKVGLEPIAYHKAYMRHIVDMMYEDIIEGRHPVPEELVYWMKENVRTKIRNPMEFERKLKGELDKIFSKDLVVVTKAMVWTGLQEIHLDEPLEFFKNQMGLNSEVMPARTRKYAEDFIKHLVLGEETQRDTDLNALVTDSGLKGLFNKALKPFGRKVSNRPMTRLLQKGGRLQIYGVMGWRPKQLIRNKFQLVQNLAFSGTKANILSFLPPNAQCKELMEESMLLQGYKGGEDLIEIDKKTLGRLWLAPFQWTAQSNARQGMKCAYIDTMELIEDPKYKKFDWADPKRTYKEEKGFIYPNEKVALLEEMELRSSCAQYNYIAMAMPEVFQSKANIPLTRLQSWWMNHFFKFQREGVRRFLTGRTVTGKQLPWSRRLGWARYMVIGGLVLNTLGYSTSFLIGAMPDATPPLFTLLVNLFKWCTTDNDKVRASAGRKIINAAKTFIPGYLAYKDAHAIWTGKSNLTKAFTYGRGIFAPKEEGTEPGRGAL